MTKYQPLYEYLASRQHLARGWMAFAEASQVIRAPLPKSAFTYLGKPAAALSQMS